MSAVLPDEVVYHIFSHLDPQSLGRALQCCRTFYRIATAPALWELPYLLRWSTGDPKREQQRGTDHWRRLNKLRRLEHHASRAACEKLPNQPSSSQSAFRFLQLGPATNRSKSSSSLDLDFYRLFLERINIDQQVLDTLYQQVEATHSRIPPITSLALRFGNDAKDVLTAIVQAQSSCPSSSRNGLTSCPQKNPTTQHDFLSYESESYRLTAYQAHLPTTLRSDTHHLVILHHAREMLEHLQRREAMSRMNDLADLSNRASPSPRSQPGSEAASNHFEPSETEKAVSLLTMFRGGEASYVASQLDVLAAACDLYLQQRFHSPSDDQAQQPGTLEWHKQMAMAICDFLADHGFRGARDDLFSDLDNHFLHYCFTTNRETLPLSLTLIFCGVANRLGLRASLCNFPMLILAFVSADPSVSLPAPDVTLSSAPQSMFWLDVCEYTTVAYDAHEPTPTDAFARKPTWLQQRPPILDRNDIEQWIGRMGIAPSNDFWRPAQPNTMVQRASRNILSSVQRAQIMPRTGQQGGQARIAIRQLELDRRINRIQHQWTHLVRVDHAFLSSYHGRTDPADHEAISAQIAIALSTGSTVAEDETVWTVAKRWRSESINSITGSPETWTQPAVMPAQRFRQWMDARALDNDWMLTRDNLRRRADAWSEHEQQAAKYAAVNAFLRLDTHVNAREVEWIAGFLQSYFMLDVDVIERDFLGATEGSADVKEEGDASSEASESSDEVEFSARAERSGTPPSQTRSGMVTSMSAKVLKRMLHAVRMKDAEPPTVNRRVGAEANRRRTLQDGVGATDQMVESGAQQDQEEDMVGYRVGTVFRHRTYRYVGSILGWDPYCAAPEDWIVNMGVDRLPAPIPQPRPHCRAASSSSPDHEPRTRRERRGGRHQPFYHSQVADGTRRYVAEVNVEPIVGPIWIYGTPDEHQGRGTAEQVVEEGRALGASIHKMLALRGLGEYFRCFDQSKGRLRRNRDVRIMFPDDWSDDDDDEASDVEESAQQEEDGHMEKLSEDGCW